jgi:hypothetical protein
METIKAPHPAGLFLWPSAEQAELRVSHFFEVFVFFLDFGLGKSDIRNI